MYVENKDNNLLASVALFSELYNSPKYNNIFDIVAEFIKATVVSERKWTISSLEITYLLKKNYDFDIPESIVRSVLKTKLKDMAKPALGLFTFNPAIEKEYKTLDDDYQRISTVQKNIVSKLYTFIESKNVPLDNEEKNKIIGDFNRYLLDKAVSDKYSAYISAFILKFQNTEGFTESLNLIREGVILYQGIRYTANVGDIGTWKNEMTIFLNTEQLFSAVGYNGELYKKIFFDFYNLVSDINNHGRNKGEKNKIILKYFEETKKEVDKFFYTAEQIKEGKIALDPSKNAMKEILSDCRRISDVVIKKVSFFEELSGLGIKPHEHRGSIYDFPEYLVEDQKVLESLKADALKLNRDFNENEAMEYFRMFSKINYFRKGQSNVSFEKVGFLMMTVNGFALYLGNNNKVKFEDNATRFAMSSDFVTSRLWFKLQKGFGANGIIPSAFNVVTKAQIVLAGQVSQVVQHGFQSLKNDFDGGKLTSAAAQERVFHLREKITLPEHITETNAENSLSFLTDEDHFEDYIREREMKDNILAELKQRTEELQKEVDINKEEKRLAEEAQLQQRKLEKMANFSKTSWQNALREYRSDAFYFVRIWLLVSFAIFSVIVVKYVEPIKTWFESQAAWTQIITWSVIGILLIIELLQRSYFADKERMKRGKIWAGLLLQPKKRSEFKFKRLSSFEADFDRQLKQ